MTKNETDTLSMDERGAWRDNVRVEGRWKSLKYKRGYFYVYDSEPIFDFFFQQ